MHQWLHYKGGLHLISTYFTFFVETILRTLPKVEVIWAFTSSIRFRTSWQYVACVPDHTQNSVYGLEHRLGNMQEAATLVLAPAFKQVVIQLPNGQDSSELRPRKCLTVRKKIAGTSAKQGFFVLLLTFTEELVWTITRTPRSQQSNHSNDTSILVGDQNGKLSWCPMSSCLTIDRVQLITCLKHFEHSRYSDAKL